MYPYVWGDGMLGGVAGLTYSLLARGAHEVELPEEVRAAIEEHRDEFSSEEDLRRFARELLLRS